ncbi:MAG: prepilin-type cleavage/methylation domain-containing protein [Gallionella sp.]|nr:prepilin-type cleavage/methylation domain-containing protein [Gallionella sp.]
MTLSHSLSARRQTGFSLVEILVGLVIGLLATLVIMQVFSVFEGQKRTTTGTADAQTNGSIALHTIINELPSAGFDLLPIGFSGTPDAVIDCAPPIISAAATAAGVTSMSPVVITDGGAGSDSITINFGSSDNGGIPITMGTFFAGNVNVNFNQGCQVGIAVTVPGTSGNAACDVVTVTNVPPAVPAVAPGAPPLVSDVITLGNTAGLNMNGDLVCLGQWNQVTYSVTANNNNFYLVRGVIGATPPAPLIIAPTPVVSDIVNLQAQYGVAAANLPVADPNFNQITQWVDASGATWGPAMTTANRNRIKAIRLAVIARNGLLEKTDVSTACSSTNSAGPTGVCAWEGTAASPAPTVDLSADANWKQYRYRVFETIVPLRTMLWSRSTL